MGLIISIKINIFVFHDCLYQSVVLRNTVNFHPFSSVVDSLLIPNRTIIAKSNQLNIRGWKAINAERM